MKRSSTFLPRVAVPAACLCLFLAPGACGTEDPNPPTTPPMMGGTGVTAGTGGAGGNGATAGTGGVPAGGTGGSITGGSGGTDGGGTAGGSVDTGPALGEYFPFAIGNRWKLQVREGGNLPYLKEQVIVRMEPVGGDGPFQDKVVFRVETRKAAPGNPALIEDATISWQLREGSKIVRYRETSCLRSSAVLAGDTITSCDVDVEDHWNPPRERIDERPMGMVPGSGLTWVERYVEFKKTYDRAVMPPLVTMSMATNDDTWRIVEANKSGVTVPAGTFNDCIVLEKRTSIAMNLKTYTFCRGVGKVLEQGTGQTEELFERPTLR
jgi:hypothetical protein